jgi:signal peptidase I
VPTPTTLVPPSGHRETSSDVSSWLAGGWVELVTVTACRAYVILVAALAVIAFAPVLFGWTGSVVQSGSMEPRISPGDVVLTTPLPAGAPIPVGHVITFHANHELVVHRIVSVTADNTLVTRGDANPQVDPWHATRKDITGQARLLVPYIGLPGFWLGHGNFLSVGGWAAGTLAAALIATRRATTSTSDGEDGPDGDEGDSIAPRNGVSAVQSGRAGSRVTLFVAAGAVLVLGFGTPTAAFAETAAFSGVTRASASWTAQAYSPITVGSMAGYAGIANTGIIDGSFLFHFSTAHGSLATTPGTTINGISTGGTTDRNNTAAIRAMAAATTARTALNQRPATATLPAALTGTVTGGVYASSTGAFTIPSTLTLDAKGDPTARFIFRTSTTLSMADKARVTLTNGAQASNVWWIVGTTANLGTNTSLTSPDTTAVGNYLVNGAATLRGITLNGRAVSYTSGITVYATTITPPN